MTNVSKRQVSRVLKELDEAGEIAYSPGDGRGKHSHYVILLPIKDDEMTSISEEKDDEMAPFGSEKDDISSKKGDMKSEKVTSDPEKDDTMSSDPLENHQKEPSGNHNKNDAGVVFATYEQEIGSVTKIISDKIGDAVDEFGPEWVCEAIAIAAESNVRKWTYVDGILKRWRANGRYSSRDSPNGHHEPEPKSFDVIDDYLADMEG